MHGPDGVDYENQIVYNEIVKPERLVYCHGRGKSVEPMQFQMTVTFEDRDGKIKRTMTTRGALGGDWLTANLT